MVRWPACKNGDGVKKELEEEIISHQKNAYHQKLHVPPLMNDECDSLISMYNTSTTFRCLTAFGGNKVKLEVEFVFFFSFSLIL
jgi:hypothetical protein